MEKKRMLATSTDLSGDAVVEITRELRKMLADVFVRSLSQDEEFPLAHECPAFPRLPSTAR
jgi:hypothetical protein